jgi:DNA-binding transcriptional ArsR family regulator
LSISQQDIVKALKALANENRLKILEAIWSERVELLCDTEEIGSLDLEKEGACCVDWIADCVAMAQSSVSQQLKELYNAGLLQRQKKAQNVYYAIEHKTFEEVTKYLNKFASRMQGSDSV